MSRTCLIVIAAVTWSCPACRERPAPPAETSTKQPPVAVRPGEWIELPPKTGATGSLSGGTGFQPVQDTGWKPVPPLADEPPVAPTPVADPAVAPETDDLPAPGATDSIMPLSPLADAAVGEWARYRAAQGWIQQYRVTAAERAGLPESDQDKPAGHVVIEVRVAADGLLLGLPAERREPASLDWPLAEARRRQASVTQRLERIYAAGRSWDCRLTLARWGDGGQACEQRTWVCPEVPVYGIVRMELVRGGATEPLSRLELITSGSR